MRHLLSICIALLFLGGVSLQAQNGVRGTVSFENVSCKEGRKPAYDEFYDQSEQSAFEIPRDGHPDTGIAIGG